MADRIPLIVNSTANQIQELPTNDTLLLSGHLEFDATVAGSGDIISKGGHDAIFGLFCNTSLNQSSSITINCSDNTGSSTTNVAQFKVSGASNTPQVLIPGSVASSSKTTGALVVTGGVGIGGKLYVGDDIIAFDTSDVTLKENITPISNAVDKVLSISGNTFKWNEKSIYSGEESTGIIAQEIEALGLPGVTTIRENGTKAVRYDRLVPLLIEAIKELNSKIESLGG